MNDNSITVEDGMYSMHEINTRSVDIKVGGHHLRCYYYFPSVLAWWFDKRKMRSSHLLLLIFAVQFCIIIECGASELTRVTRTLPVDLSPTRWFARFRSLLPAGRLWDWPRNSAEGILRLIASPDTKKRMIIEFRPEDGRLASYAYQRRYGYRGQWLIELLGSGFHPDGVPYRESLPVSILLPPPPPF